MKAPVKKWAGITSAVAVSLALIASATAHAVGGVTLFHITGTVTDALGRPLDGTAVRDGHQTVVTDTAGSYDLPEENLGTYFVTAERPDTEAVTKTVTANVPLDKAVDFTLLYRISTDLEKSFLSTADAPSTTTLTITSWAPDPGQPGDGGGKSCVYVTDNRTGDTNSATHTATNADGTSEWSYLHSLPPWQEQGDFTLAAVARDCAGTTDLTAQSQVSYSVDNLAPSIPPLRISPRDFSTTVFGSSGQLLQAEISDHDGVGLDVSSITFVLEDVSTGEVEAFSGGDVSYADGVASTGEVELSSSARYHLTVVASDLAGNQAVSSHGDGSSGGFRSSSLTPSESTGEIDLTSCEVSDEIDMTGFKTATCRDIRLVVDAAEFAAGPWSNGGRGYASFTTPLNDAVLTDGIASWPAYEFRVGDWSSRETEMTFVIESSPTSQAVSLDSQATVIDMLQAKVPATWTNAELALPQTPATVALPGVCPDITSTWRGNPCRPDPTDTIMRVYFSDSVDVVERAQVDAAARTAFDVDVDVTTNSYVASISPSGREALDGDSEVDGIVPLSDAGYSLSANQLRHFDVSDDPAGVVALSSFADLMPGRPTSRTAATCIPPFYWQWTAETSAYDLSSAAGRPVPESYAPVVVVRENPSNAGFVHQQLTSDGLPSLGFTTASCGGGGGGGGGDPEPDDSATRTWRTSANSDQCDYFHEEDRWHYTYCEEWKELYKDGNSSYDYWALQQFMSGKTEQHCKGAFFWRQCLNLQSMTVAAAPAIAPVEWAAQDDGPFMPAQDSVSNCDDETRSVTLRFKVITLGFSRTLVQCEEWDIESGAPGTFESTWRDGGKVIADSDRAVVAFQAVKTIEGRDMWWETSHAFNPVY